jgi:hypothetical protein
VPESEARQADAEGRGPGLIQPEPEHFERTQWLSPVPSKPLRTAAKGGCAC